MCLNIWTPKTADFPFGINRKLIVLGVPMLHSRVIYFQTYCMQKHCHFLPNKCDQNFEFSKSPHIFPEKSVAQLIFMCARKLNESLSK